MTIYKYFDSIRASTPASEINSTKKAREFEYSKFGSLKGRKLCLLEVPKNLGHAVVKPMVYVALAIGLVTIFGLKKMRGKFFYIDDYRPKDYLILAVLSPACHLFKAARAALGILHPGINFKHNIIKRLTIESYFRESALKILCDATLIEKHPQRFLKEIVKEYKADPKIGMINVNYNGQDGIDDGGIARDFVYILTRALSLMLGLYEEHLIYSEENAHLYKDLGVWLKLITKSYPSWGGSRIDNELPIGDALHSSHYKKMLAFSEAELQQPFDAISDERLLEIIEQGSSQVDQKEYVSKVRLFLAKSPSLDMRAFLKQVEEIYYLDIPKTPFNAAGSIKTECFNALKHTILEDIFSSHKSTFQVLHMIASNMYSEQWSEFQKMGAENFEVRVAGNKFTTQKLVDALEFEQCYFLGSFSQREKNQFINWLKSKTEDEQKSFVVCVTGSLYIPNKGIRIIKSDITKAMACAQVLYLDTSKPFEENATILNLMCRREFQAFNES